MGTKKVIKIEIHPYSDGSGLTIYKDVHYTPKINLEPIAVVGFSATVMGVFTTVNIGFSGISDQLSAMNAQEWVLSSLVALLVIAILLVMGLHPATEVDHLYLRYLDEEEDNTHPWDYDTLEQICAEHQDELMDIIEILQEQDEQKFTTEEDKQKTNALALQAIKSLHDNTLAAHQHGLDNHAEKMAAEFERIDLAQQLYRSGMEPSAIQKEIMDIQSDELR